MRANATPRPVFGRRSPAGRSRTDRLAEKEFRLRCEEQVQSLTEQRSRRDRTGGAACRDPESEIAALRQRNAEEREAERAEREKTRSISGHSSKTWRRSSGRQSRHFKQTSKESIDILLKPFKDNIVDFRKRVEGDLHHADPRSAANRNGTQTPHGAQPEHLGRGPEPDRRPERQLKSAGRLGRDAVETILDSSALSKGIHYETQYNIKDEEGRNLRPDVVLHLPEKRHRHRLRKSRSRPSWATPADTEEERRRHLAAHVASVRQHVTELGRKEYQRRLNSPDFVIMFVPNEPAFAALQNDPSIWSDAYDKKVIIADEPFRPAETRRRPLEIQRSGQEYQGDRRLRAETLRAVGSLHGLARRGRHGARQSPRRLRGRPQTPLHGNDNIIRVGERLRKNSPPADKRQHAARTLEIAGGDTDDDFAGRFLFLPRTGPNNSDENPRNSSCGDFQTFASFAHPAFDSGRRVLLHRLHDVVPRFGDPADPIPAAFQHLDGPDPHRDFRCRIDDPLGCRLSDPVQRLRLRLVTPQQVGHDLAEMPPGAGVGTRENPAGRTPRHGA